MKKFIFLIVAILPLFSQEKCTKCSLNKDELRCNYYVATKGDISKINYCKRYANYLAKTKVYDKASWYYLLAKEPDLAIEYGKKAIEFKNYYVYEFLAISNLLKNNNQEAQKYFRLLKDKNANLNSYINSHFSILKKIYKNFNITKAKEFLK